MKKLKHLYLLLIIMSFLTTSFTYATSNEDSNTQFYNKANSKHERDIKFKNIKEIKNYVKDNKDINIIVLDADGIVANEVHSDGSSIDYTYANGLISEISKSNGYSKKYTYNNEDIKIDEFKDGKLIKTKTLKAIQ